MTEQPKRNVLAPVRDGPIMKDGEVVEGPKNIFRHGVLGCCSKPDAICCAIFLDAYVCPCLVFGSMWKKTSGGEKCCNDFCYPCCGFFCGCLLGFFHVVPCLLICLRSNYRKEFKYFIRIQNAFWSQVIPIKEPKKIWTVDYYRIVARLTFVRAVCWTRCIVKKHTNINWKNFMNWNYLLMRKFQKSKARLWTLFLSILIAQE